MRVGAQSTWTIGAVLAALALLPGSGAAQPIEQRSVTFVAPATTRYVILSTNHYQALENGPGCDEAFQSCLLDRNEDWRLRIGRVGSSGSFEVQFNAQGAARLYFTCGRAWSIDNFLQLNRRYGADGRYTIACPAPAPSAPKPD